MQPSSLVFLVLIGIWAAYLLQHWVRRREYLATARSVDRFSDAMRVLERRSPLPELARSAPRPRSYAVSPARPSHPEVVEKTAQTEPPEALDAPAAAGRAPVRPTRTFRLLAGVSARRMRGLSLLASFLLVLVVTPLAVLSILPLWSLPIAVGAVIADLTWLRHAAVSQRAAARADAYARRTAWGPAAQAPAADIDYFDAETETETESSRVESDIASAYDSESAYDGQAPVAGAAAGPGPVESPVEVDPYGWAPVPVPPPTYTLKARAADPVVVQAVVDEIGDAEHWSLDGLVYDCDLDELVERRSGTGA